MKKILVLVLSMMLMVIVGCGSDKTTATPDTPEGALNGYFQALQNKDYEKAYSYLKTDKSKEQFLEEKKGSTMNFKSFEVKDVEAKGNAATGAVLFKTGSEQMPEVALNAQLEKDGDKWVITQLGMGGGMGGAGAGGIPPGMGSGGGMPPAGATNGMPPAGAPEGMPPAQGNDTPAAK